MVYVSPAFERGNDAPNQWDYVLSNFGVSTENVWYRGSISGYNGRYQQVTDTLQQVCEEVPLVVVQPKDGLHIQGTESLVTFTHPEEALYVFGSNHAHLVPEEVLGSRLPDYCVYIPVEYEMYSWVAAAVVLYDRQVKNG